MLVSPVGTRSGPGSGNRPTGLPPTSTSAPDGRPTTSSRPRWVRTIFNCSTMGTRLRATNGSLGFFSASRRWFSASTHSARLISAMPRWAAVSGDFARLCARKYSL